MRPQRQIESKYKDHGLITWDVDNNPVITVINTIPQGTSVSERIGKKVFIKSLRINGEIYGRGSHSDSINHMYVIYDRRPNGTLPGFNDIFSGSVTYEFPNDNNTGRFDILKKQTFNVFGNSSFQFSDKMVQYMDIFIPINRPAVYKDAGTGGIGDIETGAIYIMWIGNQVPGTLSCYAVGDLRVRYTDT